MSISNYTTWAGLAGASLFRKQENQFRAAIAFYPLCIGQLEDSNTPLLVLIGDQDTWCPAALCQMKMPSGKAAHEIILKIYPGTYHCFDQEGIDLVKVQKHRLLYNPQATADSFVQVREFLGKHLK